MADQNACRICGAPTTAAGTRKGPTSGRDFALRRCGSCGFGFVVDPPSDLSRVYDERYYRGEGADPLVDYVYELEHPDATIRSWEWRGIVEVVRALVPLSAATRWLDYGCGNGGLVRHLRATQTCDAAGYETGWIAERARAAGIPLLGEADLEKAAGTYDVVTAIEVLEHVADPLAALRSIRTLLRPGGLLFLTTGNAERRNLARWEYVIPEIHISFFEPRTLRRALDLAGFDPQHAGFLPGYEKIIRFKILKRLGVRRNRALHAALPWNVLSRLADAALSVTAHPVGRARPDGARA